MVYQNRNVKGMDFCQPKHCHFRGFHSHGLLLKMHKSNASQLTKIVHQRFKDSEKTGRERLYVLYDKVGNERSERLIILYVVKVETLEVPSEVYQMVSEFHNNAFRRRGIYSLSPIEGNERSWGTVIPIIFNVVLAETL